MSPSVVSQIFKEFHFRSLSPKSSKNLIYKNIINTAFETIIICSKYNKDKHIEWSINENIEEMLPQIIDLVCNYAKKSIHENQEKPVILNCEDSDDE